MKQNIFFRVIVAIAMMLIGWLPSLAHDFEVDGVFYNKTSDNTVAVTHQGWSYHSYSNEYIGAVVIPSSVKYNGVTYSVTSIGNSAFRDCSSLTSIKISNSVTSIGNWAFYGCTGLTSIDIPNSVTWIGSSAFYECSSLTSVVWNVKKCSDFSSSSRLFENSPNITSFTFGDEVEHIPARLCYGMNKLTSIEIPNSVTSIGNSAFEGCSSLTSIEIPNSVTSIEHGMFSRCSSLISIKIPNSVTSIGEWAFGYCESLTGIEIGNSVTSIGDYAFGYCESLTSIEIPNSVTSIERRAFVWCSSLIKITCHATTPPTIESDTFSDYSAELLVPIGYKSAYQAADYWKNFNNIIEVTLDNTITLNDNDAIVATIGDNIVVKNAKLGSNVRVYAADGSIITSEIATDGDVVVEAPVKGIYVVAIDGKSFKVMVK